MTVREFSVRASTTLRLNCPTTVFATWFRDFNLRRQPSPALSVYLPTRSNGVLAEWDDDGDGRLTVVGELLPLAAERCRVELSIGFQHLLDVAETAPPPAPETWLTVWRQLLAAIAQDWPETREVAQTELARLEGPSTEQAGPEASADVELPPTLTERDAEIVRLWQQGNTAKVIGRMLRVEGKTIRNRLAKLRRTYGPGVVPYHAPPAR